MLSWHIPRAKQINLIMEWWSQIDLFERRSKAKKTLPIAKKKPLISQLIIPVRAAEIVSSASTSFNLTSLADIQGLGMKEGNQS